MTPDQITTPAHPTQPQRRERGQSTVEYVGLAVAVAVLLVSIGSGMGSNGEKLGSAVAKRLQDAIGAVK